MKSEIAVKVRYYPLNPIKPHCHCWDLGPTYRLPPLHGTTSGCTIIFLPYTYVCIYKIYTYIYIKEGKSSSCLPELMLYNLPPKLKVQADDIKGSERRTMGECGRE